MIWQSRSASPSSTTTHTQLVIWDFLKMLVTAAIGGLLVSVAVTGITLLLTGNAEARMFQKELQTAVLMEVVETDEMESDVPPPAPGMLLTGEECESTALAAIERDWRVRISDKRVDVRVMQTFRLPAKSPEVATFHVQLIRGARLYRLAAQSSTQDWAGQVITADRYDRLTPVEYLELSRHQILASHSSNGAVMTSPFIGLKSADLVTIEYSYEMILPATGDISTFDLPLEAEEERGINRTPAIDADNGFALPATPVTRPVIRGAVWVEWIGNKPTRVIGLPVDADLEVSKARIEGFSWVTDEIQPGARFHLAWMM